KAASFKHSLDEVQLVFIQKMFTKKVLVPLYGDFHNFLCSTTMVKPAVGKVGPREHQFKIINFFHPIPHYASRPFPVQDQVQFIFLVVMRSEERRVGKECRSGWSSYH